MSYFTKKRLTIWALIILIAVNISALSTIVYFNYYDKPVKIFHPNCQESKCNTDHHHHNNNHNNNNKRDRRCPEEHMLEELEFSSEQKERFNELRHQHRQSIKALFVKNREIRNNLLDELGTSKPDIDKAYLFAVEMGNIHAELKKNSVDHFFRIREICDDEQKKKLSEMHIKMKKEDFCKSHHGENRDNKNRKHRKKHPILKE